MKHPLARALRGVGLDADRVAARLAVDPKTVRRWLDGRVPYPRHRASLVALTGWREGDLWPDTVSRRDVAPPPEVQVVHARRSAVASDAWRVLFDRASREIGILAYSALFLAEDALTHRMLRDKATAGVRVRILLGDPDGRHVAGRGTDEGIDQVMSARIRNALILLYPLTSHEGIELRLHDTILYNSIYRGDDELLINTHVYGLPAAQAPVLHLRRVDEDGMVDTYLDSFERVWSSARPASRP